MKHFNQPVCIFWALAALLLLSNCRKTQPDLTDGLGKMPIYATETELLDIKNLPPRAIEKTRTIFLRDSLFWVLDDRKGIHVFNIKDSLNARAITFFNIPAVTDFTIKDHLLYADNWRDLVVIDISNLLEIKEIGRTPNVIAPPLFPENYNGIFECADPEKGAIVGWKDATLVNAACFTN